MLRKTTGCHRMKVSKGPRHLWGSPGGPVINFSQPKDIPTRFRHMNIVCAHNHQRKSSDRLLHYLGKHVPQPQKSLWSPDTPVPQDRHLFKLTTLDIDAFKYWFGIERAHVHREVWKLLWRAGLLPPTLHQRNPLLPTPIFDKEELYRYFLANRKPMEALESRDYLDYENSMPRTKEEMEADRPKAPYF